MYFCWAINRTFYAIKMDALMCAIPTRDMAQIAANARLLVDVGHDLVIQIEVLPLGHLGNGKPAKILDGGKPLGTHPVLESLGHILDNAVSVVHHSGTNLNRSAAQQHELDGIAPCPNTANARHGQCGFRIAHDLLNHVQRNRLYCRAAIAAMANSCHLHSDAAQRCRDQCP